MPTLKTEFLFVSVPLVFFLIWFAIGFRDFIWVTTPPKDAMDVYVMGKQWMWKFSYPEGPNGVNVLHVPANRPVRLLITRRDVLHSFSCRPSASRRTRCRAATRRPGSRPPSRARTRFCAPSTAACRTSRCWARWWCSPPEEWDAG